MRSEPRKKNPNPSGARTSATPQPQPIEGEIPMAAFAKDGQSGLPGSPTPARNERAALAEEQVQMDLPPVSNLAALAIGITLVVLFGAIFLIGWIPHNRRLNEAQREAVEVIDSKPIVDAAYPKVSDPTVDLILPADVQAYQSTALFARANGYLKQLPPGIDIGVRVKQGQVLAEISAPEVDAELEQAKASLEQANVVVGRANNEHTFANDTYNRYKGLASTGGVTQQQLDEKRSAFNISLSSLKAAQASVWAATAAVKRLTELQGFQKVLAPFDGTITARTYDSGALISSTTGSNVKELFHLSENDKLRVYVNVPQTYSTQVKVGQDAQLFVRNYPGKPLIGKVARTSEAIDPASRTLRVEVDISNDEHKLFPGMWGQVRFKIRQENPPVLVPTSALVFGGEGMKVAVVGPGNKVKFHKVIVGRDFGAEAEVASGLKADEPVVANPGERLADGVEVTLHKPLKPQTQPATRPAPPVKPQSASAQE